MARYKPCSYAQGKFIPIHLDKQIQPGTFEHILNHPIDHELDLSLFDQRFNNDATRATAYDPRILLKIVLFAIDGCKLPSDAIPRNGAVSERTLRRRPPSWKKP